MQIKKITFNAHGLRGASIEYSKRETPPEGRPTTKTVIEKKQTPVHIGLEKLVKSLRVNLLEINRILGSESSEDEMKYLLQETELKTIVIGPDYFVLSGTLLAFEEKDVKLKTPKVEAKDGYPKFDQVQSIIAEIKAECVEYLQGTQTVTDEEVVLRWIQAGKSGVTQNDFDMLSADEKKEFCRDFLEKEYGAMVMMDDDVKVTESADVDENQTFLIEEGTTTIIPITGTSKKQKLTKEDKDFLEAPLTAEESF
jgi:hypothetical protein